VDVPAGKDTQPILETLDVKSTLTGAVTGARTVERNALKKAQQSFRTVLEIGNAIQTELDLDTVLDRILERLFGVFPQADRGFIMLKADESGELVARAARQRGRDQPEAITISRHIVQKAMGNRVAILSADAMGDQRFSMALSVMNFRIRSMMCAPIIANDEALGIIHLDTTRQDRQFTLDDLDLLAAVTNQTAFAIANAQLHRKLLLQERTERDLQLARQVQESFLPKRFPEIAGMQFCASYKAALEVGGDFYDFIPLAGDRLGIVVGDISGKGIPAALMMALLQGSLRTLVTAGHRGPELISKLNDYLWANIPSHSLITLFYGELNTRTGDLCFLNCGHNAPFLARSDQRLERLVSTSMVLGIQPDPPFQVNNTQLQPGDALLLFTDGITEAFNELEEEYGEDRVTAFLQAHRGLPSEQILQLLVEEVLLFCGHVRPGDDMTLMLVKRQ